MPWSRCWAGRHNGICAHVIAVNAFKDPKKIALADWIRPEKRRRTGGTDTMRRKVHYLYKPCEQEESEEEEAGEDQ